MEEVARNVVRVKIRPLPTLFTRIRKTWEVEWENTLGQSNFIRVDKVSLFNTLAASFALIKMYFIMYSPHFSKYFLYFPDLIFYCPTFFHNVRSIT